MQNVEYQGYGFDIADIQRLLASAGAHNTVEHIEKLSSDLPIYNYDDVIFCTPCNTDDFGLLTIIPAVIPVGFTIKTYSVAEANSLLITAVCKLIEEGISCNYTTQEDVYIVQGVLTANIDQLAGYSYDKGPWTDCV